MLVSFHFFLFWRYRSCSTCSLSMSAVSCFLFPFLSIKKTARILPVLWTRKYSLTTRRTTKSYMYLFFFVLPPSFYTVIFCVFHWGFLVCDPCVAHILGFECKRIDSDSWVACNSTKLTQQEYQCLALVIVIRVSVSIRTNCEKFC